MIGMTLAELTDACGGIWTGDPALLTRRPEDIVTDSRSARPGSLFVAFRGERTDGHRFIPDVLARGALAVLCEEPGTPGEPRLVVPEVFAALRRGAERSRGRFSMPVIGVTGSVGKTTAKEMLAAVLARRFRTFKTPGSMNGQVGIPVAFLSLEPVYDAAVIEMGISLPGEMARIARIVRPDMGVFMNIADAHLEALHDHAGILREKCDMLAFSPPGTVVFCNGDDELLRRHDFGRPAVRFGLGPGCDVRAENLGSADGGAAQRCEIVADGRRIAAYIPAYGGYMVYAALAAAAVGLHMGLTDEEIAAGMAAYRTVGHRSRVVHTSLCTLIDDCYNANPASNRAAVDSMMALPGRKVCVLGDMREMGENSQELHRELGAFLAARGVDAVYTQGDEAAYIAEGAGERIARHFPDKAALLAALAAELRSGDVVLVKASHGAHFEDIAEAIEKR